MLYQNNMKFYTLLFLIIIFNLFNAQSFGTGFNKQKEEPNYIPAYNFTLNFLQNNSEKDSLIKLDMFKNKVILLNFWATWCGPCIAEIPEFNSLYSKYNSDGFEILSISVNDSENQLKKFTNKIDVDYKILFGSLEDMSIVIQNYGSFNSVPVSYLINREGMVVRGYPGAILGEYWTSILHADLVKFLADPIPESDDTIH